MKYVIISEIKLKACIILLLIAIVACGQQKDSDSGPSLEKTIYDDHVHIMSTTLISEWKKIGINFSKSDAYYADVDTILALDKANKVNLIGMGYVFLNRDYYQGDDGYEMMKQENDYILSVFQKHPDMIVPYIAVDPLNSNASSEIDRCYSKNPKVGLKLHFNVSQVYLTEPEHASKVKTIFKKAEELNIPILLHFDNGHPKFGHPDVQILIDTILKDIEPVKLQIAHFGTSGGFNQKTKNVIDAYLEMKSKITSYHHIVFDISAVALDKDSEGVSKLSDEEFSELKDYVHKLGFKYITFGTDYPLYDTEGYIKVLKKKVGFTENQIEMIIANNFKNEN
jgi:predicted TIM-barrel fold metal-dependent hydrolase